MLQLMFLVGVFIVLSGILAMVDAAILSVSRAEVEEMILQKKRGAKRLRWLHNNITRAVVIIVIATNSVNVLGPILAGQRAVEIFGSEVIGVITGVLTFLTIIFSEIIPKSLGAHYAPVISRTAAPVILFLVFLLYPLVWLLERLTSLFQSGERNIGTEEQIRSLVTLGRQAGYIESDEHQLIQRAFVLNDRTAADVMKPVGKIVSVRSDFTIRQAANAVFKHPYSRYPVFGKSSDDVMGLVMSHDILEALTEGRDAELVMTIIREVLIVSAKKRCDNLMAQFRDRHIHLAIVQKEGKTVGLVTLEDILEELVGEIEDERDSE